MESLQTPDRMIRLAVDLVNTRKPELLTSAAAFRQFLLDHAEPEPVEVSDAELAEVVQVRERLWPVFGSDSAAAAAVLNGLLADYAVRPYLSDHDDTPWHLHVARPDASWAQWLAAAAALGLAGFAAGHGFEAIGTCAAPGCEQVFVNPAERRARRFCGPTCASRVRVASYRARRSTTTGGPTRSAQPHKPVPPEPGPPGPVTSGAGH